MKHDKSFDIYIKDMWFNNKNLIEEWQNHIESYQDLVYGQCYRFNSGSNMSNESIPIKKLKTSGLDDGFWLDIRSKSESESDSLVVFIHNYTQIPATIYNRGRFISNDSNNYLIIKRIYEQKLELPYNDCYKNISQFLFLYNQTIIDYIKSKKREYSQKECIYLCRNLKFIEFNYCKCKLQSYDHEIWNCWKTGSYTDCYDRFINDFTSSLCFNYCPLECDSFTYETTLYKESINTNSFKIFIYFEELKYTLISQQAKIELFGLISNLGGILGLFISFSFISLLELFELIAEFIYILFD